MKKSRKKRIVRRKRRVSEKKILRLKRKLMKRARKLRLGAKRTGAYVYGTLRRIAGNPYTADQRRRIVEAINECNAYIRKESARRADIRPREAQEHLDFCRAHKQKLLKMLGYDVAERYLKGNPYSKTRGWYGPKATQGMTPQEKLRYYVSGAIARGEAEPIVGTPAHRPIPQVEPAWKYGIYTGRSVVKKNPNNYSIRDIKSGDRIQLHPGTDMWMRGARYGVVVRVGKKWVAVRLDATGRTYKFSPSNIGEIYPNRRLRGNPSKNYYSELLRAGIPMDHHESDLYVMDTPEARRILSDWPFGRLERFRSNINGKIYIDVPFGYMPYWERKMR